MPSKAEEMYKSLLKSFPAPGGGGAHQAFWKAGAFGYRAQKMPEAILADIRKHMPEGGRPVSDEEIEEGVRKGWDTAMYGDGGKRAGVPVNQSKIPKDAFAKLVSAGRGVTAQDIADRSPVKLDFPGTEAGWRTLDALYRPTDLLYIGGARDSGVVGGNIRPAADWIAALKAGTGDACGQPHIIVNPLSGKVALTKSGARETYRGDNNVVGWKYMVVEMDNTPLDDQLAFWSVIALPVCALVMSGGKSVHGWIKVDCGGRGEWEAEVENELFPCFLVPLGADPSCRNESRLSRMPGHVRPADDPKAPGALQRLIYLAPEGKAVAE